MHILYYYVHRCRFYNETLLPVATTRRTGFLVRPIGVVPCRFTRRQPRWIWSPTRCFFNSISPVIYYVIFLLLVSHYYYQKKKKKDNNKINRKPLETRPYDGHVIIDNWFLVSRLSFSICMLSANTQLLQPLHPSSHNHKHNNENVSV